MHVFVINNSSMSKNFFMEVYITRPSLYRCFTLLIDTYVLCSVHIWKCSVHVVMCSEHIVKCSVHIL